MENKKLLKFLYKDIAEIEELFVDKGSEGFDEYEIEFIQSRFKGAKQVIQILSEKENKQLKNIRPRPAVLVEESIQLQSQLTEKEEEESDQLQSQFSGEDAREQSSVSADEEERLQALSKFEEEVKEREQSQLSEEREQSQSQLTEKEEESTEKEEESVPLQEIEDTEEDRQQKESDVELDDEEEEVGNANHRLGDRFLKEKSVNELLAGDGSGKLEYKISNSPLASIKAAIGINDRYQYIRELFEGNGDTFTKVVSDLDNLNSIQEAVSYLQQNYKWKKNETSLKFVHLVKRRFPNG